MIHTVDGGRSVVGQGARVSEQFRTSGVWRYLRNLVFSEDVLKRPEVERICILTKNKDLILTARKAGKVDFNILIERVMLFSRMFV